MIFHRLAGPETEFNFVGVAFAGRLSIVTDTTRRDASVTPAPANSLED